jgi:hypothetical protein
MNWPDVFRWSVLAFAAYAFLFQILYVRAVLPRLRAAGHRVGLLAFAHPFQQRFVVAYLASLEAWEERKWHNRVLARPLVYAASIWLMAMAAMVGLRYL